ncbi:MAG: pyrroline-5-carboxylate reductase [Candidatus Hydrogenedentes bacterium]|nr:pyrroline-5-carboxylate reductase [Candidatus Hydrogenedentota bacterium]
MGRAIAVGLVEKGAIAAEHLAVYDVDAGKQQQARELGAAVHGNPSELAAASDVILLAVKPQTMAEALEQLKSGLAPRTLIVSIAAGVSIAFIAKRLGEQTRVVRVMPNTPALVNAGAAGIALAANCTAEDQGIARAIFESIGVVEFVNEPLIDAVTALSGSGPAYFFYMVECLVKAAQQQGLTEKQATALATQTLLGSGLLLQQSGESAATLRERVTSKGGTTEAALKTFREKGLEGAIAAGVQAAVARAKELGQ